MELVLAIWFQGCSLKNTEFIVGAVIFTGHETKVRYQRFIVSLICSIPRQITCCNFFVLLEMWNVQLWTFKCEKHFPFYFQIISTFDTSIFINILQLTEFRMFLCMFIYSKAEKNCDFSSLLYKFCLLFEVNVILWEFGMSLQVMMNSMNVPSKRSTLERKLDKLILTLFGTLFTMCLIGAIGRCGK